MLRGVGGGSCEAPPYHITRSFVPLDLILPDQPNRAVRTRMLRGVGGGSCEAPPYPDSAPSATQSWKTKMFPRPYDKILLNGFGD